MNIMYERCAGLDVHKKTVVACVLTPEGQETCTFSTRRFRVAPVARPRHLCQASPSSSSSSVTTWPHSHGHRWFVVHRGSNKPGTRARAREKPWGFSSASPPGGNTEC